MQLLPVLKPQFHDSNGNPLSGGKLYSYVAGTSTPMTTYVDATGATPNTNPVILDANGEASVWVGDSLSYKFVLTDSDDVVLYTVDNVGVPLSATGSGWTTYNITNGQAATALDGQTFNADLYSSAKYECEIQRAGGNIFVGGPFEIQLGTGFPAVVLGFMIGNLDDHGLTFSMVGTGTDDLFQLMVAASSGEGDGTIKLKRTLVPL